MSGKVKIQLLVSRSGPNGAQNRGDVVEVTVAEMQRMVDAGQCIAIERSSLKKPEKAVKQ